MFREVRMVVQKCKGTRVGWLATNVLEHRSILYLAAIRVTYPSTTTEGAMISFHCAVGFTPNYTVVSTCTKEGEWNPNPFSHTCNAITVSGGCA